MPLLKIGTRQSPLALWQTTWTGNALKRLHPEIEIVIVKIRTLAEKFPERPAIEIGTGIFTREIDDALLRGDVDLAVHSLKDVASEIHPDLKIAAVPEREDPLDAFISADGTPFERLPPGAKIGTGSPRRKAQLLHSRPDLEVVPLRGNVATRLRKMREEGLHGIVLAHAGIKRLGEESLITHLLPPEVLVPAVSQGALGIMARAADGNVLALLGEIDHAPSRTRVTAERSFLRHLRGGCQVPAGALAAFLQDGRLRLVGVLAAPDGSVCLRGEKVGAPDRAAEIGIALASELLDRGGAAILGAPGMHASRQGPLGGRRVVVTRSEEKAGDLIDALERLGACVTQLPVIRHALADDLGPFEEAFRERGTYSHLVFTSRSAVEFFAEASSRYAIPLTSWEGLRVAAVGPATARAAEEAGLAPSLVSDKGGAQLARELLEKERLGPGSRVLLPRSSIARRELETVLAEAGVRVQALTIYTTVPEDPGRVRSFLEDIARGSPPEAIILASPSALSAFLALGGESGRGLLASGRMQIISIGPTTSEAIREAGFQVSAEAASPSAEALAEATLRALQG